jgi:putative SOS response-associated peptidase YedK
MPAVILPEAYDRWLDTGRYGAGEAASLLLPVSDGYFVAEPVSLARRASEDEPAKQQDQLKLF